MTCQSSRHERVVQHFLFHTSCHFMFQIVLDLEICGFEHNPANLWNGACTAFFTDICSPWDASFVGRVSSAASCVYAQAAGWEIVFRRSHHTCRGVAGIRKYGARRNTRARLFPSSGVIVHSRHSLDGAFISHAMRYRLPQFQFRLSIHRRAFSRVPP